MGRAALLAVIASVAVGCDAGTAPVLVDLRTDLVVGVEVDRVELVLDGERVAVTTPEPGRDYVAGARVAELGEVRSGHRALSVALVRGATTVARRSVEVEVEGPTVVTVVVTRDCRSVACPMLGDDASATACLGGRCVDPGCTPETPDRCPPAACGADGDCPARAVCAVARCLAGSCLYEDGLACGAGRYCDPDLGCLARPGEEDAGPPDAGPPDAGPPDAGPPDAGPPDAGPPDAGSLPCLDRYGAIEGVALCSEEPTRCILAFDMIPSSLDCDDLCGMGAGVCLIQRYSEDACVVLGSLTCTSNGATHTICECSR